MAEWRKVISTVLLAGSLAFAQYGYDDDSDSPETSEESYSYGSDDSVGEADASGDEWAGFKYEEMGLTQWEFQQLKESGVSRDKLTRIVELGVRPSEYMQRPWEKMGISEDEWLGQRSQGMDDADIDRSYRNRSGDQSYAYFSLVIPSLYQWKAGETTKAAFIDAIWVAGVGATAYMLADGSSNWFYFLIPVVGAHVYSFIDAFFGTQWDSNPDANRFSYGILPTPTSENAGVGVTGFFNVKF